MRFQIEKCALVAAILVQGVSAGAAANIQACIYSSQEPAEAFTINWKAGSSGDQCMYSTGHDATMIVRDGGLTCTSVGYVYHKGGSSGGDLCATDKSIWSLSYYSGGHYAYTGYTVTHWEATGLFLTKGHVWLGDRSEGTTICAFKAQCTSSSIEWTISKTPDVYIIFQLEKNTSDPDESEEFEDQGLTVQSEELR